MHPWKVDGYQRKDVLNLRLQNNCRIAIKDLRDAMIVMQNKYLKKVMGRKTANAYTYNHLFQLSSCMYEYFFKCSKFTISG